MTPQGSEESAVEDLYFFQEIFASFSDTAHSSALYFDLSPWDQDNVHPSFHFGEKWKREIKKEPPKMKRVECWREARECEEDLTAGLEECRASYLFYQTFPSAAD